MTERIRNATIDRVRLRRPWAFLSAVVVGAGLLALTSSLLAHAPVPSEEADDFMTGGGWIPVEGEDCNNKGNFGFVGGVVNGRLFGNVNYRDHCTGDHIKGKEVLHYCFTVGNPEKGPDDPCRRILWSGTFNDEPATILVQACDNGEPGRDDTFEIWVMEPTGEEDCDSERGEGFGELIYREGIGTTLGGDEPGGGNIQLHRQENRGGGPTVIRSRR